MSILETVSTPKKTKHFSSAVSSFPDIAPSTRIEAFTLEKAQFSGLVFF